MKYKVTTENKEYEIEVERIPEEHSGNDSVTIYPSASVLLEVAKDEYAKERERTNTLDNKAGVFIAAIIAMITVFIPVIPFGGIIQKYSSECKTDLISVSLCILALSMFLLIIAFYKLYKAFSIKAFMRPKIEDLQELEILHQNSDITEKGLIAHYSTIVLNNQDVNKNKVDSLNVGLGFSLVGFLLLAISAIILQLLV